MKSLAYDACFQRNIARVDLGGWNLFELVDEVSDICAVISFAAVEPVLVLPYHAHSCQVCSFRIYYVLLSSRLLVRALRTSDVQDERSDDEDDGEDDEKDE